MNRDGSRQEQGTQQNAELPARTEDYRFLPAAEKIGAAADAMEEFNRILWQIAKSVFIVAAMFFAAFLLFAMYVLAQYGLGAVS